jgi:hypothetical protein
MDDDPRCCGSGTCIIDADGRCWCGKQANGREMCAPALTSKRLAREAPSPGSPSKPGDQQQPR